METVNLEENFKLFYRIAKVLILELRDEDKVLAAQWLRKLAACQSPGDSERRNQYMTLLLITLQQKRVVGPFKKTPPSGNKLEPFSKDFQPTDIQKLLNEELAQVPPPPLVQFGLAGGPLATEFAVTQEIPKFGVHFYYVYTLEPIYDFQQANQSRIPRALQGPSQSTMRELNAGVERLLRSEKKKLKIVVDQSGRKQIKIRDEHFAQFSESRRPRMIPKRLQKRLGFQAPEPEPDTLTSVVYEQQPSPRRTPQAVAPSTSTTTVEEAVAAAVGSAVATAASAARRTGAIPKTRTSLRKPGAAPPKPPRQVPTSITRDRAVQQPTARVKSPAVPIRTPLRFTPHPDALPTPPLFAAGAPARGLTYQPEQFGLDPGTKFIYPTRDILSSKWTPKKRGTRVQMRDIISQHPFTEELRQTTPEERQRIPTPEIEQEVQEIKRRSQLISGAQDTRTRQLMQKYYATKPVRPRAIDFSVNVESYEEQREDSRPFQPVFSSEEPSRSFQPFLLDDSPVDELIAEQEMPGEELFAEYQYYSPPRTDQAMPAARSHTPRTSTPRAPTPSPRQSRGTDWLAVDEDLLDEEDIQLVNDIIGPLPSPRRRTPTPTPRTPISATRRWLEEQERSTRGPLPSRRYTPEVSPGGKTARLIDISGEIPPISPKSPTVIASMMDNIIMATPERMNAIMTQISHQVDAHQELIESIEEIPRTPSIEKLKAECAKGAETLKALQARLNSIRQTQSVKPKTPPQMEPAEPELSDEPIPFSPLGLSLQLQDLSDVIDATLEGAQAIQEVADTVPDPVVQEAADKSTSSVDALQEISDRIKDVATIWEQRIMDLDTSSLGLIEDELLDENVFGSPEREATNRIVDALDQSVREVIAEGCDPHSPAAQNLQTTLRDFKQALQNLSFDSTSFLDGSFRVDELLEDTIEELEISLQSEAAALSAISQTPGKETILSRAEGVVEGMNDVLDDILAVESSSTPPQIVVTPPTPPKQKIATRLRELQAAQRRVPEDVLVMLDDVEAEEPWYEPFTLNLPEERREAPTHRRPPTSANEILDEEDMTFDDFLMDDDEEDARQFFAAPVPQFEDEILNKSFMETDDIFGEEFVASPTRYTPSLQRTTYTPRSSDRRKVAFQDEAMQQHVLDLLENTQHQQEALIQASRDIQENSKDAVAIAASQQVEQRIASAQQVVTDMISNAHMPRSPLREEERDFAWLGPMGGTQSKLKRPPSAIPSRPTATRRQLRAPTKPSGSAPARSTVKPPAIRRPARGASPQAIAQPTGVQMTRPRAGSATPVPVRRPPQPIPLPSTPSSTHIPAQASSSIRTMLPRPSSRDGPVKER
ncbi:uncharacterized protein LOC135697361 [Ochlerotatus camptorhynchus]|uniref:uncharacterized protein LOC135697361 n=1 Tax=Ochlerotatus camptorhynchus TaxID=644619 RepID=UPI0031D378F6